MVVVCPADIRDDALKWGEAGLIADSFWLSSSDTEVIDPDKPNSLRAHRITPREVHAPSPLASSLADLGPLDEVRVAWIRPPEDIRSQSLKALEHLLRQMFPPDPIGWLDIVMPTRRTDRTVVPLPGQWVQLRILPEDRSAPDVTDAGWDLELSVPLHAALVAVGILGCEFGKLKWATTSAAEHYEFRAFSRVLLGALNTQAEVHRFVAQTMPAASAGRFFPERYLELDGESSRSLVSDAVEYMLQLDSGALSYHDPESSQFTPPPRLTLREQFRKLFRFFGYCLRILLGMQRIRTAVSHSRFHFDDLGHNVGEVMPIVDRGLQPTDFDALDAEAAEEARTRLDEFQRKLHRNPPMPPARAWRTLIQLATSINDGGYPPDDWKPPEYHGRRPVVAASWVQPAEPGSVSSSAPELAAARSPGVAVLAGNDARRRRRPPLVVLKDATGVVRTAQTVANEGNTRDQQRLAEQLDSMAPPSGREPVSFLDRLSGRIIGAGLRARLDAERWSEFATEPSASDQVDLTAAERKFRKRTLAGVAISAGVGGVWGLVSFLLRKSLPAWLTMPVGFIALAVVASTFLLWGVYAFFKVYTAFMERGRRRLEIRRIWLERACVALVESARLRAGRRVFAKWLDILAAIFPYDGRALAVPQRTMPARAPKGMAIAVPAYSQDEMTKWLAEEGAECGWRMRAVEELAANAFGVKRTDAIKRLAEDNGLQGGPLVEVWERRHQLWNDYAQTLHHKSTEDVAERMVESDDRPISFLTPRPDRRSETSLRDFAAEPWPDATEDEVREWDAGLDFKVRASRHHSEDDVNHNPDTCLIAVRIQLRRGHSDVNATEVAPRANDAVEDDDVH